MQIQMELPSIGYLNHPIHHLASTDEANKRAAGCDIFDANYAGSATAASWVERPNNRCVCMKTDGHFVHHTM